MMRHRVLVIGAMFALAVAGQPASARDGGTAAAAPATGQRPIEDFAALPALSGPRLSPDGTRVAALVTADGVPRLVVIGVGGAAKDKPATAIGTGEVDVNWVRWVNDEWLIAQLRTTTSVGGEEWPLSRLIAFNADGSGLKTLVGRTAAQTAGDVLWVARDGRPEILLAYQTSIYSTEPGFYPRVDRIDVSTGRNKREVEGREGVFDWYADPSGVVRMGIGTEAGGTKRRLLYRSGPDADFRTVDRAVGDEELMAPDGFLPGTDKAVTLALVDGYRQLHELDLATMTLGAKLYAKPGYDLSSVSIDPDTGKVMAVGYTDTRPRVAYLDPVAGRRIETLRAQAAQVGMDAWQVSSSRDKSRLIVLVDSPDSPGSLFLVDTRTGDTSLLSHLNPRIGAKRLHPVKSIRYKARDGLEIEAVVTLPKGRSTNLPMIVLPHGGPSARDSEDWDWWAQFHADRGYAVIQPNYRGSTGYGDAFQSKGAGQWGLAMQDDVDDARAHMVAAGIADPKRVCIAGASYGGYVALRAAERNPDLYRCAISYAGVSDLARMMQRDGNFLYGRARRAWMKRQAPDYEAVSPLRRPQAFGVPVLIGHGSKDDVVPVQQSRQMVERLKAAGKPHVYVEQKGADHNLATTPVRQEWLEAMDAFLKTHNPA